MGRILVIRGGAIGDFVLTLPALGLLRESFPDAWIEILGYKHIVSLAEGRFYADASRSIEYGPLARFFVRNAELDPELVQYFGSFHQVISYLFDPDHFFEMNLRRCGVKNFLHSSPTIGDSDHAAKQLAQPLERLALFLEDPAARLHPTPEDLDQARNFLGAAAETPFLALHPGSGGERKNWPLDRWVELVQRTQTWQPRPRLLICSGEADADRGRILGRIVSGSIEAHALPLPLLGGILTHAQLFLGHDSGISHIAGALNIPSVLLFGPTDPEIWAPCNPNVQVLTAPEGSLGGLEVDAVESAAEKLWRKSSENG